MDANQTDSSLLFQNMDQELKFEKTDEAEGSNHWLCVLLRHYPDMPRFAFHPCFKPFCDYWLQFQRCIAMAEFPENRVALDRELGVMVVELHNLVVTIIEKQPQQYVPEDCESSTPYMISAIQTLKERVEVMQHILRFLENGRLLGKDPLTALSPLLRHVMALRQQQNVTSNTSMQGMQSQFYIDPSALMQPCLGTNELSQLIAPIQPLTTMLPQQQQVQLEPMQLQQMQPQSTQPQQAQPLPIATQPMEVDSTPEPVMLPLPSPPQSVAQHEIQQLETKPHLPPRPETPPESSSAESVTEELGDTPMSLADEEEDDLDDDDDTDYRDDDDHEESEEETIDEDDEYIEPDAKVSSRRRRVPRVKQPSESAVVKRPRAPRQYTRRTATSYDAETTHYLKSIFFSIYSKRDKLTKDQRRQVQQHTGLKPRNITYWFSNHKRRFQTSLHVFKETVRASKGKIKTYDDFLNWRFERGLPEEVMEHELDDLPPIDPQTPDENIPESTVSA